MNSFCLGAQVGGRLAKDASAQEQELRDVFNRWTGHYSNDVREFAFLLRIDGERLNLVHDRNLQGFCSWVLGVEDLAIWTVLPSHK